MRSARYTPPDREGDEGASSAVRTRTIVGALRYSLSICDKLDVSKYPEWSYVRRIQRAAAGRVDSRPVTDPAALRPGTRAARLQLVRAKACEADATGAGSRG